MSFFDDVNNEVNEGLTGRNAGIPMGFERLNRYISIRRRIMTLVFGATGSGKSAFVHSAYILHPIDHILSNPNPNIKFKVILFSMERSRVYILAKWVSRKIFLDYGILIPIPKLLGWWDKVRLTQLINSFLLCRIAFFSTCKPSMIYFSLQRTIWET